MSTMVDMKRHLPTTANTSTHTPARTATHISPTPIADAYDVVVIGARAAGASVAMLLARAGLSVLAIDRGAYGSDTLSTHSLAGAGVLQLSRWGLLDAIHAAGTPATRRVVFRYGDREVPIDIPSIGDGDGLYSPRRTVLDSALVDAAVAAGADVRHGVAFGDVIVDARGRVVGAELSADGVVHRVHARMVIGADGTRSAVARRVGARTVHSESTQASTLFAYFEGLDPHTIVNVHEVGRSFGVIPTNDDLACVWVAMPPDRFDAVARGRLAEAHGDAIESVPELTEIRDATPVGGYRGFPGLPGFLREAWGPGWALVGDAGYFKDPLSAHGITDAFIGAELLADAVISTIGGSVPESEALGEYRLVRDAMAAELMPPVALAASFPEDLGVVQQAFRDMSAAMRAETAMIVDRFNPPVAA